MRTLRDFDFKGKRVLVRVDFNVPLSERGEILDDFRIRKALPTIKYLIKRKAKIILISHLGRPDGKRIEKYSLKSVAKRLEKILRKRVKFLKDCLGKEVEKEIEKMKNGEIVFLENVRFYKEEIENDENFAKRLSQLADIFINEAFSVCHRNQASVVGITKYLPSGAGFLLEKEIKILSQILKNPKRPLGVIIGGKKVKDKAKIAQRFFKIADFLLLGNLVAREIKIKDSPNIFLPLDSKEDFDIGEKTIKIFKEKIKKAKMIFWTGPLGKIEEKKYQRGTREIAKAILKSKAFSVVGGGETIEFLRRINLAKNFDYLSIGGGALLEFLAGKKLPGITALEKS